MEQTTLDNVLTTSDGGALQQVTIIPTWHVVLCLIIGTFGIFGNSLTLTVLFKRKRWTSVNVLIGIMSVSDLFVIPFVVRPYRAIFFKDSIYMKPRPINGTLS